MESSCLASMTRFRKKCCLKASDRQTCSMLRGSSRASSERKTGHTEDRGTGAARSTRVGRGKILFYFDEQGGVSMTRRPSRAGTCADAPVRHPDDGKRETTGGAACSTSRRSRATPMRHSEERVATEHSKYRQTNNVLHSVLFFKAKLNYA